jgi:hypothetical protein
MIWIQNPLRRFYLLSSTGVLEPYTQPHFLVFLFLEGLKFELRTLRLQGRRSSVFGPFFVLVIFGQGGLENYLPRGWPGTSVLHILASLVARITGMSHQHPAIFFFFFETQSHYIAQAGLKLAVLLSQAPQVLGLQVCINMPSLLVFCNKFIVMIHI